MFLRILLSCVWVGGDLKERIYSSDVQMRFVIYTLFDCVDS